MVILSSDLDQLALSPQCGFATGADMFTDQSAQMQTDKLALIVNVAREVWGDCRNTPVTKT